MRGTLLDACRFPSAYTNIAERWAAACQDRLTLIVHVGHNSLAEARALAAHALKLGADAVAAFAPSFFKPAQVVDLAAYCAAVAAAPEAPFYYYHIPAMTGVHLSMPAFLRRRMACIIIGVPLIRRIKKLWPPRTVFMIVCTN